MRNVFLHEVSIIKDVSHIVFCNFYLTQCMHMLWIMCFLSRTLEGCLSILNVLCLYASAQRYRKGPFRIASKAFKVVFCVPKAAVLLRAVIQGCRSIPLYIIYKCPTEPKVFPKKRSHLFTFSLANRMQMHLITVRSHIFLSFIKCTF